MGTSTVSLAMFNSYVSLPEGECSFLGNIWFTSPSNIWRKSIANSWVVLNIGMSTFCPDIPKWVIFRVVNGSWNHCLKGDVQGHSLWIGRHIWGDIHHEFGGFSWGVNHQIFRKLMLDLCKTCWFHAVKHSKTCQNIPNSYQYWYHWFGMFLNDSLRSESDWIVSLLNGTEGLGLLVNRILHDELW